MGCTAVPAGCSGAFPRPEDFPSGALGCSQPWSSPARQGEWRTAEGRARGPSGLWGGWAQPIVRLHGSYLDELSVAGECAAEYLALYQKLITSAHWKVYLAARGVLPYVGNLITKVCRPGPAQGAPFPSPALLVLFLYINFVVVFTPGRNTCSKCRHTPLYCAFFK